MVNVPEAAYRISEMHEAFTKARVEVWLTDTLWHWQWWLLVALIFLPWVVWWKLVDKRRITELFLFGMLILITSSWMDELGTELQLWFYPFKPIPWYPQLFPINFSVLPVTYMLIYQWCPRWRLYLIGMAIMAGLYAWAAEPLLSYMAIYKVKTWRFSYSFPMYILIGMTHRWFLEGLLLINKKHNK